MESLKYDYSIDLYTNMKFDIKFYSDKIKKERKNRGVALGVYQSQAAALYYKEVYNKEYENVLNDFFDIPKCPIKNLPVSLKCSGVIKFQKFSKECTSSEINNWVELNNSNKQAHTERMKIERKGKGNSSYGIKAWNNGLGIEDERIQQIQKKRLKTIENFSEEKKKYIKQKQSYSAKERLIHGHTGHPHSEETKQILREKTLKRLKEGKFPQTNTLPCRLFKDILINLGLEYEEEFKIDCWSFDFKIKNFLIEIQGDYWHSNPLKFPNGPKTKGQKVNWIRDKIKKKFIKENSNYELIEFWESDIINDNKNIELCLKKLLV